MRKICKKCKKEFFASVPAWVKCNQCDRKAPKEKKVSTPLSDAEKKKLFIDIMGEPEVRYSSNLEDVIDYSIRHFGVIHR